MAWLRDRPTTRRQRLWPSVTEIACPYGSALERKWWAWSWLMGADIPLSWQPLERI